MAMALTRGVCQLALLQRGTMYDNNEFDEAGGSPADSGRVAPTAPDKFEVLIVVLLCRQTRASPLPQNARRYAALPTHT